jgi:TDG/mug DNA glycosylase family protein
MNQYYAHSRNAFWKIMATLFDFSKDADYRARLDALKANHIALWDVIGECVRPGSLDSRIENGSIVINDFPALFENCPDIRKICFNGAMAEKQFMKSVYPVIEGDSINDMTLIRLPSTSPAMASLSFEQKLVEWSVALENFN